MLVYMFRELVNYCVTHIGSSQNYSLSLHRTPTKTLLFISFWSGNVYQRVCIGAGPRGVLVPRKLLDLLSSFITLFETPPTCVTLIDMCERLNVSLTATLPGSFRPSTVNSFGPNEFDKCLSLPTARIIERHDFRTIIDFLLTKLRTALDRDWLQSLPLLHKVRYFPFLLVVD